MRVRCITDNISDVPSGSHVAQQKFRYFGRGAQRVHLTPQKTYVVYALMECPLGKWIYVVDDDYPLETSAKAWIEEDGSNVVLHDTGWMPTVFLEELMCKCLDHAKGKAIQTKSATMHIDIEVHNDERVVMEFSRRLIKRMKSMALGLAVDWKCI